MSTIIPPEQGRNYFDTGSIPAVGTLAQFDVPDRLRIRVYSLGINMTTDGTAANRYIRIYTTTGFGWHSNILSELAQTASTDRTYTFLTRFGTTAFLSGTYICAPFGGPFILPPGSSIRVSPVNLQAGDQLSAIGITGESWIEP